MSWVGKGWSYSEAAQHIDEDPGVSEQSRLFQVSVDDTQRRGELDL